jgi:hypothetical protein
MFLALGSGQAFDFGDELTIGGRDAVSSPPRQHCRKRSSRQPELSQARPSDSQRGGRAQAHSRQLPVALGPSVHRPSGAQTTEACRRHSFLIRVIFARTEGHIALWEEGALPVTRGRSCKTAPPR